MNLVPETTLPVIKPGSSETGSTGDVEAFLDDSASSVHDEGEDQKEKVVIARAETRKVGYLRVALFLCLLCVAGCISFAMFWKGKESEQNEFESYAKEACRKVVSTFQSSAARRIGTIASFTTSIASNAAARGESWPNVTVPDFEMQASMILDLAAVMSITVLPVVTGENMQGWVEYTLQNKAWFNQSLAFQEANGVNYSLPDWKKDVDKMKKVVGTIPNNGFEDGLFRPSTGRAHLNASDETGPFFPWWQFAPVMPVSGLVNYDTSMHSTRKYPIRALMETGGAVISNAFDYANTSHPGYAGKQLFLNLILKHWSVGGKHYQEGPVSDLYFPVFDMGGASNIGLDDKKVVAMMTAYIYWQAYFEDILPPNTKPVVVVLENVCGGPEKGVPVEQQFTYEVNGERAEYIGAGDLHDPSYDYLKETTGWQGFLSGDFAPEDLMQGQCFYNVHAYPSRQMEDSLRTNEPLYFMLVVLATFAVTSLVFMLYDHYVEQRQQVVMTKAVQSTEVVQELFPENVRERLFEEEAKASKKTSNFPFLHEVKPDDSITAASSRMSTTSDPNHARDVVADLYQNCTVYFADIAGFTKWSSNREPTHVFQLLETLYGAFDRLAKRHKVFKVETIGDCYLGITGLPQPQKDHAVIMVKFAGACVEKMTQLTQTDLVEHLGEETSQLKLRVGIHSGPVTAGVLRGERARYQIFGDTVNTASRMESNSLPGMIQVSAETANLLRAANRGAWLTPREGGIEAKGKGSLDTYWVQPKATAYTASTTSVPISCDASSRIVDEASEKSGISL
ncbi:Receptor-type guanylate cyclase gcy [Seminavis robusta]|uniref:Receptor-type guanylate cyclase gcy n=1 Tax=Seminavis robusta TaxID=568900 RepID=A0A9N8EM87_9STRA|nr:Receptor-type guanylate cyclase gcy [Seminavis robusta]|eukprot:Sro1447_g273560.1 Receptor-type guanylate cyclase gcy (793) ;mRNA; r:11216-13854